MQNIWNKQDNFVHTFCFPPHFLVKYMQQNTGYYITTQQK